MLSFREMDMLDLTSLREIDPTCLAAPQGASLNSGHILLHPPTSELVTNHSARPFSLKMGACEAPL